MSDPGRSRTTFDRLQYPIVGLAVLVLFMLGIAGAGFLGFTLVFCGVCLGAIAAWTFEDEPSDDESPLPGFDPPLSDAEWQPFHDAAIALRSEPPVADAGREQALVDGLRKAVADDETEWVDANIVRLLLDRYDGAATRDDAEVQGG